MDQNSNSHSYENSYDIREYYKRMKKGNKDLIISYEYWKFNPNEQLVRSDNNYSEKDKVDYDFLNIYDPTKLDSLLSGKKSFSMNSARRIQILFDNKLVSITKSLKRADFLACWLAFKYNTKVTISSWSACTIDVSYDKNNNCFEYKHNMYFI